MTRRSRSQPEQLLCFGVRQTVCPQMYRQGSTERNLGRRACVDDAQPVLARVELDEGPPKDRVGEGTCSLLEAAAKPAVTSVYASSHSSALTSQEPKTAPTCVIGQVVYDPIASSPSAGMRNLTAVTTSIPSGTGSANPVSDRGARKGAGRRVPGNRGPSGVRWVLEWIAPSTFSSGSVSRTRLDPSVIR